MDGSQLVHSYARSEGMEPTYTSRAVCYTWLLPITFYNIHEVFTLQFFSPLNVLPSHLPPHPSVSPCYWWGLSYPLGMLGRKQAYEPSPGLSTLPIVLIHLSNTNVFFKAQFDIYFLWWLIFCVNLTRPYYPDVWSKIILDVSVKVIFR